MNFEARGKPSTVFPRAGPVETERFSSMWKFQQDHYTIDNSSTNQFVNAPPSAWNAKIAQQPNPQCPRLSTRPIWNKTLRLKSVEIQQYTQWAPTSLNLSLKKSYWRRKATANAYSDRMPNRIVVLHIKLTQRPCCNLSIKSNHQNTGRSMCPAHSLKKLKQQQINLKNKKTQPSKVLKKKYK